MPRPLVSLALAILLATTLSSARAEEATTVRVSTVSILDAAPLHAALSNGFFKEAGLAVETVPAADATAALAALAAGEADVAFADSVSIARAAAGGLGLKVIAAGSFTGEAPPDPAGLVAHCALGSGKALAGKRVAVDSTNGLMWLYVNEWVGTTGGDPSALAYVEMPFAAMAKAVRDGEADAAFIAQPFLAGARHAGLRVAAWPYNTVQRSIPLWMYAATASFTSDARALQGFVGAYNRGVEWMNANAGSAERAAALAAAADVTPDAIDGSEGLVFATTIDPATLQPTIDLMRAFGLLDDLLPVHTLLGETVAGR